MENKNTPVSKVKKGTVEITGWKNEKDGKTWISYQLQRSYKVGEEWKQQKITLQHSDLPKISIACMEAFSNHYDKNKEE